MKKYLLCCAWVVLSCCGDPQLFAEEKKAASNESEAKKMRTGILFETQAIDPEVFTRLEGSQKALMVPVYEWEYGVRLFKAQDWEKRAYKKGEFRQLAEKVADAVLDEAKIEFIRDSRDVVLYAVIRSKDPFLSSILLSKKFLPKFKKNLGEVIRVIILDRQEMYVFPDSGGKLADYASVMAERYLETKQPVSLEIFQVSDKGFKIIGSIGE
ncbi:MAG: hypothetical protein L3J39_03255 [Verrucomicrobiales bacterium]|nr:hypothetical protein [Verrucomicrobiales bacterium]